MESGRDIAEARRAARVQLLAEEISMFFAGGVNQSILELGCGHGHWLTSLAESFPEDRMIGVDMISRRIRLATGKANRRSLANIRFIKAEASEVLEAWPPGIQITRIFLLHPDPWPKKRHAKNRMTGQRFLSFMADATKPGCELYFRTDDPAFFSWSEESLSTHPAWSLENLPWPHEAGSYFKDMLGVHGALTAVRV